MCNLSQVAANLGHQVRFQVVGTGFLLERVGVVLVRKLELELIDDVPDPGRLLHRAIGQHGLVGRGNGAREGHDISVRLDRDRQGRKRGSASQGIRDATRQLLGIAGHRHGGWPNRSLGLGLLWSDGRSGLRLRAGLGLRTVLWLGLLRQHARRGRVPVLLRWLGRDIRLGRRGSASRQRPARPPASPPGDC